MKIITSLENNKIKQISKLKQKKYRDKEGKFLVFGNHLVEEAKKTNNLLEIIQTEDCNVNYDIPTTIVTYEIIKKITGLPNPQKIIGVCKKLNKSLIGNKILIIDNLQDPGNLGTIIRSSVAFNIDTIILSENTVDLYNDKVLRSSEGMIFNINILKKDINIFIDELKTKNYKIYGTKVDGGTPINKINYALKSAIIVGNEGAGIRDNILNKCDEYLYIPMEKECESLNVGIATSIILYEMSKLN